MNKDITIFHYLNAINYKTEIEYDKKIAPAFMLSMWLSHDPNILYIVNKINEIQFSLADNLVFEYYMTKIPRAKRFLKWTKKDIDKKADKKLKEMYKDLNEKFQISKSEFEKYKKLILKGHMIDNPIKSDIVGTHLDEFFQGET